MEIWDGYLADGTPAGQDLIRGKEIPAGLHHIVCEILVQHADGDILLMKRDLSKPNHPGMYEGSAGGSAFKGEDKWRCAKRELQEETGIEAEKLEQIGENVTDDTLYYEFLCITDFPKDAVTLQKGETIAYKWLHPDEFAKFIHSEEAIPSQIKRYAKYFKSKGWMA